nr:hypothetical protein [uncultured Chitinophaga sp.]
MNKMNETLKELGFSSDFIKSFDEYVPCEGIESTSINEMPMICGIVDGTDIHFDKFETPDVTSLVVSNVERKH